MQGLLMALLKSVDCPIFSALFRLRSASDIVFLFASVIFTFSVYRLKDEQLDYYISRKIKSVESINLSNANGTQNWCCVMLHAKSVVSV